MLSTIEKWEDALGVIIPRSILSQINITQEGQQVNVSVEGNKIILEKASANINVLDGWAEAVLKEVETEQEDLVGPIASTFDEKDWTW